MRRSLILLLTITVALVLAAPASAGKPNCVEPPYHPSCPSDDGAEELPAGGTVCDPATEANHDSWAPGSGDTFTVTLSNPVDVPVSVDVNTALTGSANAGSLSLTLPAPAPKRPSSASRRAGRRHDGSAHRRVSR